MRKSLILFFVLLLLFSCRDSSQMQSQVENDIGLKILELDGKSLLEKMDYKLSCYAGEVEKYSVSLKASPINKSAFNVDVIVNGDKVSGVVPYFTCSLKEGYNEIKITLTSKKDVSKTKIYTIRLKKKKVKIPNEQSSKLKELKVDGSDVLSLLDGNIVAELPEVAGTKQNVVVDVIPYNASAEIDVENRDESVSIVNKNRYNVSLASGLNEIKVTITSDIEGEKLHIIKIYREEDLNLKSFNVDGTEYCKNGRIKFALIAFESAKTEAIVKVEANLDCARITLKHNGNEVIVKNGSYKIMLEFGKSEVEVIVKGRKEKTHSVTFIRPFPSINNAKLLTLKADDEDLLHRLSKDNIVTLSSCENDKKSLKIEARASVGINIKVLNNTEILGDGVYNVGLNEGLNRIVVRLYNGASQVGVYLIFITRYPEQEVPNTPATEEVQVSFVLSDGVNGSPVDGAYINVFKTKEQEISPLKRVLIRKGKAKLNLLKNEFYDFKVEGRASDGEQIRYAASDVISYYVDEKTSIIPIVQFPLQRVTRPAISPVIQEFKYGNEILKTGKVKTISEMKTVSIKVLTSSPIERLDLNYIPKPMLGIGFVPTNDAKESQGILYASESGITHKNDDGKYESSWNWSSLDTLKLIKGDEADAVIVLYDAANNRLEYHVRFKTPNKTSEEEAIEVSDFNMEFIIYPTSSRIFSIGKDSFTHSCSHYSNRLLFKVKKGNSHVTCKGFDIYRRCVENNEDFKLIKHFVYALPKTSDDYGNSGYHRLQDDDGVLEDEKTYQYKVVAYTTDDKKSKLDSSPMLEIKVPKTTSLLLDYPVNTSVSLLDAQNMDYAFKLSNPKILETAKEIRLGFLVSDREGKVRYASKFKYVFDDSNGKDEIYFATLNDAETKGNIYVGTKYSKRRDAITSLPVENLIKIDKITGTIKLTKSFTSLTQANLVQSKSISYTRGTAYYWDILDWGVKVSTSFDDLATKIVSKKKDGVTIISITNDELNGNNALNGRAEFSIKFN